MTAVLHNALCKTHNLPFPHRVITVRREIGKRYQIVTFVVCALCGHWTARTVPTCRCPGSCHMEARNRERIGQTLVESQKPD
jgi:hypothetical protein